MVAAAGSAQRVMQVTSVAEEVGAVAILVCSSSGVGVGVGVDAVVDAVVDAGVNAHPRPSACAAPEDQLQHTAQVAVVRPKLRWADP